MKTMKNALLATIILGSSPALAGGGGGGGVMAAFVQGPQPMVYATELSSDRVKFSVATWTLGQWSLSQLEMAPSDVQSELLVKALQRSAQTREWQQILPPQ